MKMGNEKGMALITTMLLGFLAMAVVAALMTFMIYGKKTSVVEERYTSALEAAKGGANFIMNKLDTDQFLTDDAKRTQCIGQNGSCPCWRTKWDETEGKLKCPDGKVVNKMDLKDYSQIGDYKLEAIILHKDTTSGGFDIYAIRLISTNIGKPEKAEIDFIYRTSPPVSP